MLRNLRRFFYWRTVPITIIVRSSVRAVIWPVIPVVPVMALIPIMLLMVLMAIMLVVTLMTLMTVMLVMAQMYSWIGMSVKVRL